MSAVTDLAATGQRAPAARLMEMAQADEVLLRGKSEAIPVYPIRP